MTIQEICRSLPGPDGSTQLVRQLVITQPVSVQSSSSMSLPNSPPTFTNSSTNNATKYHSKCSQESENSDRNSRPSSSLSGSSIDVLLNSVIDFASSGLKTITPQVDILSPQRITHQVEDDQCRDLHSPLFSGIGYNSASDDMLNSDQLIQSPLKMSNLITNLSMFAAQPNDIWSTFPNSEYNCLNGTGF